LIGDTVIASVSYTLPPQTQVECLRTVDEAATTPINLTGNTWDNLIIGNAGDNVLDGGVYWDTTSFGYAGMDTLRGLGGNDSYYVDGSDTIVELAGQGDDIVYARYSYTLNGGAAVETLATVNAAATDSLDLTGNEFSQRMIGNAGNNALRGAGGNDELLGGAGNDRLIGGSGSDRLEGGAGADSFIFEAAADSRTLAMRSDGEKRLPDTIVDFAQGSDKIDLGAMDAIAGTQANDVFSFIGSGAFTHQAGQLRFETAGGRTSIFADLDGDGSADMQILLLAPVALTAGDFIL
jgi:serralysin